MRKEIYHITVYCLLEVIIFPIQLCLASQENLSWHIMFWEHASSDVNIWSENHDSFLISLLFVCFFILPSPRIVSWFNLKIYNITYVHTEPTTQHACTKKKKNCTTTYFFPLNASIMVGSLFKKFCANIFLKRKKKINLWLLVYTTAKNLPLPMSCSLMVLKTIKFIFEKTPTFSAYVSPLCFQIVHFLWYF